MENVWGYIGMIRVCTVSDLPFVNRVLLHPDVMQHTMYDGRDKYPIESLLRQGPPVYVMIDDTNSFCVIFVPETNATWIAHTNALPSIRGNTFNLARMMTRWMFDNTPCHNIMGYTPSKNKRAIGFNQKIGHKLYGIVKNGIIKDGELDDLHIYGLEKGEW